MEEHHLLNHRGSHQVQAIHIAQRALGIYAPGKTQVIFDNGTFSMRIKIGCQ
jgi:hypothetical protein